MRKFRLFFANFLGIYAGLANSATINVTVLNNNESVAEISGTIVPNDGTQFIRKAERARQQGAPIKLVLLNSGGGSVQASYQIAQYLIDNKIYTIVDDQDLCVSACFNIFIAGKGRYASPNSRVGVHRISDAYYGDNDSARGSSIDMNSYFKEFDVPNNIRLAMLETPPEQMYYLTAQDKKAVSTVDLSASKKPAIPTKNENDVWLEQVLKQSSAYYDQQNYQAGISLLEQARQSFPQHPIVLGDLGWGYGKIGETKSAITYLMASLKITPQNAIYWGYLAEIYADAGYNNYAVDSFVKMYQYSQDKNQATNQLYDWSIHYPNTNRDVAASMARQKLGIY